MSCAKHGGKEASDRDPTYTELRDGDKLYVKMGRKQRRKWREEQIKGFRGSEVVEETFAWLGWGTSGKAS